MIEVLPACCGYRWHWISAAGRVLFSGTTCHPSDLAAWREAAAVRARFWGYADTVDHRQARCI